MAVIYTSCNILNLTTSVDVAMYCIIASLRECVHCIVYSLQSIYECTPPPPPQAAVLHDTVEDTDTSFEELEVAFGQEVRALVGEVSDDKSLPKMERKRLQVCSANTSIVTRQHKFGSMDIYTCTCTVESH